MYHCAPGPQRSALLRHAPAALASLQRYKLGQDRLLAVVKCSRNADMTELPSLCCFTSERCYTIPLDVSKLMAQALQQTRPQTREQADRRTKIVKSLPPADPLTTKTPRRATACAGWACGFSTGSAAELSGTFAG